MWSAHFEPRSSRPVQRWRAAGIRVSLFIDADRRNSMRPRPPARRWWKSIPAIMPTPTSRAEQHEEFERIAEAVAYGQSIGLQVNAGHGLHYHNVQPIAALPGMSELNIGHAIVAQALFVGWENGGARK